MDESPLVEKFVAIVKSCRKERSLANAHRVLRIIEENGLEIHEALGNYVVPMLVDCGDMHRAHSLFNKLAHRSEHSWTSLIQGWVEHEDFEDALYLFDRMQEDNVNLSAYSFLAALKACTALKCLEKGRETHASIVHHAMESNPFISSSLVDMYSKCFSYQEAGYLLSNGQHQDVVLWNALISGYVQHGGNDHALVCLVALQKQGICPNAITFACCLKACGSIRARSTGQELHIEVIKRGYEWSSCVDGTILYMYSKCSLLAEAYHVLNTVKIKNAICWTSLIAGYAEHGYGKEALVCLRQMQLEGTCPNVKTYTCCVKGCYNVNIESTQNLYIEITTKGYDKDTFISNSLLDVYGKQNFLLETIYIFYALPNWDIFSWNGVISCFLENGCAHEALCFFDQMQSKCILANAVTFFLIAKACCIIQDLQKGQSLHMAIVKRGMENDDCIETCLMDMYMKLGLFEVGLQMFKDQIVYDVVSWTTLLSAYVEQGYYMEALQCLQQMQQEGVPPSAITYICCLKACAFSGDKIRGCQVHFEVIILGFEADPSIGTSVVEMYIKCGAMDEARLVFDGLKVNDDHAWNSSLFGGYEVHECQEYLLRAFDYIDFDGACPDSGVLVCMSRAYDGLHFKDLGYAIHCSIIRRGLEHDPWIASSLIVLYGNAHSVAEAECLLTKCSHRNVVLWTALITAYVEHGQFENALRCLETMRLDAVSPNGVTLVCGLKAAATLGLMSNAQAIHTEMLKKGLETDFAVGNSLVDLYAKFGYLHEAQRQLERLPLKCPISWTTLIAGFACHGNSKRVFQLLERMDGEELQRDGVTYLSILIVCSHGGLIEEGLAFFTSVSKLDSNVLGFEHLSCIVDLLARAGQLESAVLLLEELPFQPNLVAWTAMLGACRKWQDLAIGNHAFENLKVMDKNEAATFLLMLDIYGKADTEFS